MFILCGVIFCCYGISVPDDHFSLRAFTVPTVKFGVECFLDLSLSLWFMVVGCDCHVDVDSLINRSIFFVRKSIGFGRLPSTGGGGAFRDAFGKLVE